LTALDLTAAWPVDTVAAAVVQRGELVATVGDTARRFRLASITKPIVAWAMFVAVEEGTISLDSPAGQPGCTLRHLLAHAGGCSFDGPEPITAPGRRRIYSNTGIEIAADAVDHATSTPIGDYLCDAVLQPLGMNSTTLDGSPAHGAASCVDDLVAFLAEMRSPTLIATATRDDAFRCAYPELSGIVPGVGRYAPCPWGLGFEIRGEKSPHWTGQLNSARTVGHFGGAGTMLWFDPEHDLGVVALSDREFGPWALDAWPELSDAVIADWGARV
jgi:CubicO group peptidase (beta-lactamase class C family)